MTTVDRDLPGVLVIDDQALVRSFLRSALEALVRVEEAADGERALELLKAGADTTDLVFVDHVLPGCSGLEVLQNIKRNWPWMPVVIITGFGSEYLAVQALRAGASDYLRKPIELNGLLQTVTRLLAVRPARASSSAAATPLFCDPGNHPRRVHPNIRRALVFISEHFTEPISLAAVAREARLSRFHFCRLFHRELGVPFHEYVHDLRVRRAKTLLADRYLRISEIAYTVGFNDLSHFDRTFRRMVGLSPSEYRASQSCA